MPPSHSNHQPSDELGLWPCPNTRHCVSNHELAPASSQWPTRLAQPRVQRITMRRPRTSIETITTSRIQVKLFVEDASNTSSKQPLSEPRRLTK